MARTTTAAESDLITQAKRIGLEKMLEDVEVLLATDLPETAAIPLSEMRNQIIKHLEAVRA